MAKINSKDVEMINHKLITVDLPNYHILDYDIVEFKNGKGRYTPKTELLVVKAMEHNQPAGSIKISFHTFRIVREALANSIESLIKQ